MNLFFSGFSMLSARRGNSRFLSLLTLNRYSKAETLRESPGASSLDGFESTKASALTYLTGTARRLGSLLPKSPYLWGGFNKIISRESTGSKIVRHSFYDPTKKKEVFSGEEIYPALLTYRLVGASHGWFMRSDGENVYLTDLLKPWVSSPRVISLPSLKLNNVFFPGST